MFYKPDLILLHAPGVYDFRKSQNLFGPISDVVPSTPIFEMYPVGFSSIAEYLERNGMGVRIVNLAYRMLEDPDFDVEKMIARLHPKAFGIDLHWLVHCHGSIEIAKICKKYHPKIPIIFGGLSSTYFHEELIRYPEVDFVLRGDTTEIPMHQLMTQIVNSTCDYQAIHNLSWQDDDGVVHVNPLTYVPDNVNSFSNNYKNLFKIAVKYGDIKSMTAIHDWWRYPITAVMTVKGCTHNCIICGGAHKALKLYANRHKPAYRDPKLIVEDIRQLSRFTTSPIFIVGDLNQPGAEYADAVLSGLKKLNLKNQMVLEFFDAANRSYYEKVAAAFENFNFEISPESHDEAIRRKCGKLYSNEDIENNIQYALEAGCQKFDVFFMIGVAGQTADSVLETVDYCEYLLQKFGTRVVPFIAPLAPFLDPGSIAFENPEQYGYKILFHTLEEHRQALTKPSWKYFLNYETNWLSRDQIVEITYEAGKRLNQVKFKYGQIDAQTFQKVDQKIELALRLVQRIDDIMKNSDDGEQKTKLAELKFDLRQDSVDTVCEENEIKWPMLKSGFRYFNIAKAILFE